MTITDTTDASAPPTSPSPRRFEGKVAFIKSWFEQFTKRCAWRAEWENIEQARAEIGEYIQRYNHRPHSGIGYRTPTEVAATRRPDPEPENLQTQAT